MQVEHLEPTNNSAERAIRPAVLWKIKGAFSNYQDKIIKRFNLASNFVIKRQILSFILCFLFLMIIGFLLVFVLDL